MEAVLVDPKNPRKYLTKHFLTFYHLNVRSMKDKMDELDVLLTNAMLILISLGSAKHGTLTKQITLYLLIMKMC